jgi:glycosyltransferase involved in cell wall biosynthesis
MIPRVLHVIDHSGDGGAQVVVHDLISKLRDRFEFRVAILGKSGRFTKMYRALNVPVFVLKTWGGRWNPCAVVRLVNIIRQNKIDLVHTHLFKSNIVGTVAAKLVGVRTILHDHWGVYPETLKYHMPNQLTRRTYLEIYRRILKSSDRTLVLTEEDSRSYQKVYSCEPNKITVLPNSIELNAFSPDTWPGPPSIRENLGLSTDTALVLMIGRLEPEKDWFTFLRVAQYMHQQRESNCAFLVVGSGSEEQRLRNYVLTKKLERVFFLGYRSDIPQLLSQGDVFLSTSCFEPFGIVLLEAMAAGCPVVATRSGGAQSIVTDEVDGLLCDIGDVQGLSNQVRRLLSDQALRQRIAFRARQTVLQFYDLAQVSVRVAGLYEDVLRP